MLSTGLHFASEFHSAPHAERATRFSSAQWLVGSRSRPTSLAATPFVRKLLHRLGFSCAPNALPCPDAEEDEIVVSHSVASRHVWSHVSPSDCRSFTPFGHYLPRTVH
jgi:hypothetical protein